MRNVMTDSDRGEGVMEGVTVSEMTLAPACAHGCAGGAASYCSNYVAGSDLVRRRTRKNTLSTEHGRAFIFSPSTSTTAGSGFVAEYQSELLESTSNTQVRASATAVSPRVRGT